MSACLWYWAWRKLNSSLMRSHVSDTVNFSCPGGGGGPCQCKTKARKNKKKNVINMWENVNAQREKITIERVRSTLRGGKEKEFSFFKCIFDCDWHRHVTSRVCCNQRARNDNSPPRDAALVPGTFSASSCPTWRPYTTRTKCKNNSTARDQAIPQHRRRRRNGRGRRERGKGGGRLTGDESNKKKNKSKALTVFTPQHSKTRRSLIKTQTKRRENHAQTPTDLGVGGNKTPFNQPNTTATTPTPIPLLDWSRA